MVNSSLGSAKKSSQRPTTGRAAVSKPDVAQSSHSPKDPFIPSHICRQRSQSPRQLNKQFSYYLARKNRATLSTYTAQVSSECTKRAGTNTIQSVPRLGVFTSAVREAHSRGSCSRGSSEAMQTALWLQSRAVSGKAAHKHFCAAQPDQRGPNKRFCFGGSEPSPAGMGQREHHFPGIQGSREQK